MNYERRSDDSAVAILSQKFSDFIERYERDQKRYEDDQKITREWRDMFMRRLDPLEKFADSIRPWHSRFLWIISLTIVGTIAYWIKWFWTHLKVSL